jgi:hypothetical protein
VRALILVSVLAAASSAHADVEAAREDIVDMRKGRMPAHREVLGWTEQGAFVFRESDCGYQDLSDQPYCHVTIYVAERGKTASYLLFNGWWEIGCGRAEYAPPAECWKITTEQASAFIRAERELREKLGPLTAGTSIKRELANGTLTVVRYEDQPADRRKAAIALLKNGRWKPLAVISSVETGSNTFIRKGPVIERVERSPDGESIAVLTSAQFADTDYYWTSRGVDVLPMPR